MEEKTGSEPKTAPENPNMFKNEKKDSMAILSYIGILCLVPLLGRKENKFTQYHAKQGFVLFIAEIATILIAWIPIIGWFIGMIAWIVWLVLSIIGIMNVVNGEKKPLPVLGQFAKKVNV
ncbi:MAG: DUF4870 domain-containing protein [Atribacterota bacterium]